MARRASRAPTIWPRQSLSGEGGGRRCCAMRIAPSRVWLALIAAVCSGTAAFFWSGPLTAQSVATPSFTDAQATQGKAAFDRNCVSCHGPNLDDGEFAPPLKG